MIDIETELERALGRELGPEEWARVMDLYADPIEKLKGVLVMTESMQDAGVSHSSVVEASAILRVLIDYKESA